MIARQARPDDAAAMTDILNEIIAIGGTTAHQHPKSVETVRVDYVDGPDVISSVVVEDQGRVIGWQSVGWYQGAADIGSFVRPGIQARGAGGAMFALTRDLVGRAGISAIMAAIRADNVPGLAYYARIGFVDVGADPDFALQDGRVVGGAYTGGSILFEVAAEVAALLVGAAFVAGLIDSIAGGGGLITVPVLLLAGASPVEALATNKVQGSFGAGTAVLTYARAGQVRPSEQLGMAAISAAAGACGALVAHLVPVAVLRLIMPVVLIGIAAFFALKPGLTDAARAQRVSPPLFALTAVPLIAAYDGFFGPGTGSFFMMAFVMLAGYGVLKATAHTKMLNFASNLGSLAVFATTGATWWAVGLAMGAAQVLGAMIGARLALRVGARVIKPLLVVTSTGMALRLIWQAWG